MPVLSPNEFTLALPRQSRVIGLDLGSKTIGMALSDLLRVVATPFDTIRRSKFSDDSKTLLAHIDKHEVAGLVVGWPVEMSGQMGPRCQSTMAFINNMLKLRDMPVMLWDERLSTSAVTRTLLEADTSRAKRAQVVDKMAAAYILQGALDILGTFGKQANAELTGHQIGNDI
jgi:putative Holliday junction resolvase